MQPAIEKIQSNPALIQEPGLLRLLRELSESSLWSAPKRRLRN